MKLNWTNDILNPEQVTYQDGSPKLPGNVSYNKTLPAASCEWVKDSSGKVAVFYFTCPCGCGQVGACPVNADRGWKWDGDLELPTLTPSILMSSGCCWHGYLTKGEFVKV